MTAAGREARSCGEAAAKPCRCAAVRRARACGAPSARLINTLMPEITEIRGGCRDRMQVFVLLVRFCRFLCRNVLKNRN